MKSNLLLALGIPLAFLAVLFGFETGQPLWFFLCAPLAVVVWLKRREVQREALYVQRRLPDRQDVHDAHHTAHQDDQREGGAR